MLHAPLKADCCEGPCERMRAFAGHTNIACMLRSIYKHKHMHCVCGVFLTFSNFLVCLATLE